MVLVLLKDSSYFEIINSTNKIQQRFMFQLQTKNFDWHSKSLTIENCGEKLGNDLMGVLVLPTADIFLPLLQQCEFPQYLINNLDVWKSVFADFSVLYRKAIDDFYSWEKEVNNPYLDKVREVYISNSALHQSRLSDYLSVFYQGRELLKFNVHLKAWYDVLNLLAIKTSIPIAIELERWVYRHYFSDRFANAMQQWWVVLQDAESVPESLLPIISEIDKLINFEDQIKISDNAQLCFNQYWNDNGLSLVKSTEDYYLQAHHPPYIANSNLLITAFTNERVLSVLRMLSRSLNSKQIKELVEWARIQLESMSRDCSEINVESISVETSFLDLPSILNANKS